MTVKKEGTQFLRWFGPLLDALRALGGSGTLEEPTDKVAELCNVLLCRVARRKRAESFETKLKFRATGALAARS